MCIINGGVLLWDCGGGHHGPTVKLNARNDLRKSSRLKMTPEKIMKSPDFIFIGKTNLKM